MDMPNWNSENTAFVMAASGYARTTIEENGIRVFSPYHGDNLPLRIFREICFRLPVLPKVIWYNKSILSRKIDFLNLYDANITRHYLKWIKKHFPESQINFIYNNMVGKARNISPENIPHNIRIWTYDDHDSRKYSIRLYKNYWVREMPEKKKEPEFDIFFIGKDKGRGEYLLALEKKLKELGLTTKFIITKDGRLSKNKEYYQRSIPYEQVLDYDTRCRAILNVTMEDQEGVTMRDMESAAIGVKLITTNTYIVNKDLYNSSNVFILGVDDFDTLPDFLDRDYVDMWTGIKENHTFEALMNEITG